MKNSFWLLALSVLLIVAAGASLLLGRYPVPLNALWGGTQDPMLHALLWQVRLPEILAAILVGAALSGSGSAYQALFLNPLVSPSILGVLSGAAFGAALAIVLNWPWIIAQGMAFGFGLAAVLIALSISRIFPLDRLLMLVLGGILTSALFTALLTMVQYLANPYTQLPAIIFWLMGSLSGVRLQDVLWLSPALLLALAALWGLGNILNVLSLGEEEALSLGVSVRYARLLVILLASVASALTVPLVGVIGWVGLIVPHLARFLVGPDHRRQLPASILLGGIFLLLADDLARSLFPVQIPLGVATDLLGIATFLLVLRRLRKSLAD